MANARGSMVANEAAFCYVDLDLTVTQPLQVQTGAVNVNGYTTKDYLARLDKYKPKEYSRVFVYDHPRQH